MRITLQLAQEYNSLHDREKSLELSLNAISLAGSGPVEEDYCLSSIYGNVINCFMELYSYDEAIEKGEQYIEGPTDKLVKAVIAGRLQLLLWIRRTMRKRSVIRNFTGKCTRNI